MEEPISVERVREIKARYEQELLSKPNVVGLGIGYCEVRGQMTDQIGLIVMVRRKVPRTQLAPHEVIPPEIEGVPTDVREVGEVRPLN
ncbi:MAG: hypothetical protein NUW24_04420 [Anaerolineae bacterium]|jgi:hypothetical protein|nr:hypothetical protein [Anaerolineae bacterium]MDH7474613.1 hypothetical protein [Anaerolineae bacterium]